ncbi:MAG: TonB-dependent [Prolixibacteraceae bacterium]|nr:MAG: TonB-dependent [Prolixibacteraceae bacterium]
MRKLIFIIYIILPFISNAQNLQGVVFGNEEDGKTTLPGVNIYWQGTNRGVVSTDEGTFEIKKGNNQHMLVFSFVGYETKVVHVDNLDKLEVVLEPNLEIEEVTVVKKDRGTYLSAMETIHTERIGSAELHKAACCNLAESFETNPSVDISYSDAVTGAKQIRLLGLDGIYSQLQIENLPDLRGLATTFGLTYIPGPWMESIQVSKGASSVVGGYESIAGQINAEIKKPDSGEKLFLNAYANHHGRLEFNANTSLKVYKDMLSTGILVHASGLGIRNDDNGDGFLDDPLSKQLQISNRWKFTNYKGFMIQAGINILTEDRLGGQVGFEEGMAQSVSNPYGISIKNNRVTGFMKSGIVSQDQRTALAILTNFTGHKTNSFYGLTNYDASETRFYGSLILTRDLDKNAVHTLNAGVSFIHDNFSESLYNINLDRVENVPGVFAEYTLKPVENMTLMAGIRADSHNMFGTFVTPRMHFRYKINDHLTLRANAGKGYRTANIVTENNYLLAGYRKLQWHDKNMQEEAWNYGVSLVQDYILWGRELQINTEFFKTDFHSQLVVDRESSAEFVILSPLSGKSYANSLQLDVRYQPIERFDVLLAYRLSDTKHTIGGELKELPLNSRYKGLLNLNYSTNLKKWMFNYTIQFNGGGRIPRHYEEGQNLTDISGSFYAFQPYTVMNAQVTRYFRYWNVYLGSENITNFKQPNPIEGAYNPFNHGFDASNIWGPVVGRKVYLGVRFLLNYN